MRWFAMTLLALSVACGSESPTAPATPTLVGTWTLETVGGARLPYVINRSGADVLELVSANLVAKTDGSFSATSIERSTIAGDVKSRSYIDPGHFTMSGATVTLTSDVDGAIATGTIGGDSLIFVSDVTLVYRRK